MAACSAASALNETTEGIAETSARLHAACRTGSIDTVTMLLNEGADITINARNNSRNTALHTAVMRSNADVVRRALHFVRDAETAAVLLEFDADINARDEHDSTPLLYAAEYGRAEVVRFLLREAGADVNAVDRNGNKGLMYVVADELAEALAKAGYQCSLPEQTVQLLLPQLEATACKPVSATVHTASAGNSAVVSNTALSTAHVSSTTQQAPNTLLNRTTSASATVNTVATNSMLDLWLCDWLHEIGFARHDANDYAAAMTKLKCCSQRGLAALNETKAMELATAAVISYFDIDMFIVGWQQLKASSTSSQQLRVSSTVQIASSSACATTAAVTAVAATAAPTAVSQCCPICMEDQPADNMLIMPCNYHGHSYCVECLLQHCSTQLLDNGHVPRCPGQQQCQYELSHVDLGSIWQVTNKHTLIIAFTSHRTHCTRSTVAVHRLLQSERYAEMKLIVLTAALDDHCPAATASPADVERQQRVYNTMMLRRGLQDVKAVSCGNPSCNNRLNWLEQGYAQWVRDLHGAEHQLQRSQAEQQAAQELRARHDAEQATNAFLVTDCRHCPHCNSKVERMEGCDSMVCGRDYHCGNAQDGCGNRSDWATARRCIADTATTA
eukprot:18956-Heterococcus_DN1.PRE.5